MGEYFDKDISSFKNVASRPNRQTNPIKTTQITKIILMMMLMTKLIMTMKKIQTLNIRMKIVEIMVWMKLIQMN